MRKDLQKIVENKPEDDSGEADKNKKWIDAYIFVYDSSEKSSFNKLLNIIKSVHEFEESFAKGRA